jgi:hypothetical protein
VFPKEQRNQETNSILQVQIQEYAQVSIWYNRPKHGAFFDSWAVHEELSAKTLAQLFGTTQLGTELLISHAS